jgi:hypothetical protein
MDEWLANYAIDARNQLGYDGQPTMEDIARLAANKWWPRAGMAYTLGRGVPLNAWTMSYPASIPLYALGGQ